MNDFRKLTTIEEVVGAFLKGEYPGISSVTQAGEMLIMDKGKNISAEFFLLSFLTADPDAPGKFLASVLENVRNRRERIRLINRVKEICFAFLWSSKENLQYETQSFLQKMESKPPYPEFFANVMRRIQSGKMLERVANLV